MNGQDDERFMHLTQVWSCMKDIESLVVSSGMRRKKRLQFMRASPALLCLLTPGLTIGLHVLHVSVRIHAQVGQRQIHVRLFLSYLRCRPL